MKLSSRIVNSKEAFIIQLPSALPVISERKELSTSTSTSTPTPISLNQLGNGFIGKLCVMKSGKLKLRIGHQYFDVDNGTQGHFHQQIVSLSISDNQCHVLSDVKQKLIISPDVNSLFSTDF